MNYIIKKGMKEKIKNKYLVDGLGYSETYVSQLLNRKRTCPKHSAYAITMYLNKNGKIKDYFEKVGGK